MGTDVEKTAGQKSEENDFTDLVGGNGPWQRAVFFVFFLAAFPSAWHNLAMSFFAPNIDHWCAKPPEYKNVSIDQWKLQALPREPFGSSDDYSKCQRYEFVNFTDEGLVSNNGTVLSNNSAATVVTCQTWDYDRSVFTSTVVSQWNLVCDKAWMVSMTKSVFMLGFLTSVLVFGQLSDKIGRKPVIMASVIILVASGIICAFSISFIMFTVSRFFVALGAAGIFNTGFVMLMEIVSADSRSVYGIAIEFGWSTGYVLLPAMAWLIRDWFWLQLLLTLPCVGLLAIWWVVPESPRWLLTQGKTEKAQKILSRVADRNKREVQDMEGALKKIWLKNAKENTEKRQGGSIIDLVWTPGLWQKTINLYFNWFVNSFIYYGLSFNTNDLAGNPFVNFAISGAVEFPAYFITIFVIKSVGRRIPLMATMVAGGLSCLLTVPLTDDIAWVRVPLAMFGKFCITASFGIVYVYTTEIFPTVVRNTGLGTCSMCARIGSILAPFVKELGEATHPAVPLAFYGILSVISGLLVLLLPETNHCKVPDTLQEAADFGRKKKKSCPENSEVQKPCAIHDCNEKVKQPSPTLKPASDGKKLPDLLEEPSVVDEGIEDGNQSEENQAVESNEDPNEASEDVTEPEVMEMKESVPSLPEDRSSTPESAEIQEEENTPAQQTPL